MKHIVGFSGGIDSQAAARYLLNRYDPADVILVNSDAGENEHPLTTEHVLWHSANVHPVVMVSAIIADIWETENFAETKGLDSNEKLDFGRMIALKGRSPSRKAQFCTEILKLKPQRRWMREVFGPTGQYAGEDYERYTGVRRDESDTRKDAPWREWDSYYDCWLNRPIFDWTKQMCFDFVKAHGEKINPLYTLGFNRVGCAPCINSSKADIQNWAIRFPEMIDKVQAWETASGRTFFPPMVPGLATNNIAQVVEWAKTSRGGRQSVFPILLEREACESKYGLCE